MNLFHFGLSAILLGVCLTLTAPAHGQLNFNTSSTASSEATIAFEQATDAWAAEFSDGITVNLAISFSNLGSVSLANAIHNEQSNTFTEFTNAINADQISADDQTFAAGLPVGSSFSVYINRTTEASGVDFEVPYVDNDGGLNNSTVLLTTANAKALGLRSATDSLLDGGITFNSSFTWDFDRSDGIDPGAIDFVGVAMHEIGHVLGFVSGVDALDANGDGLSNDDDFTFVSSIDFLRFSSESESAGADIDWTADNRDKYLALDGGATPLLPGTSHWATGFDFGDGDQASHWKDGQSIGLMSPTTGGGMLASFSATDLRAFDVIGYNRFVAVPEPGCLFVLGVVTLAAFARRRRQS